MSHCENKVNWCLKKAQEEVKQGKKHRGLIVKKSDSEEIKKHLEKAEHNLLAISFLANSKFSDWSMSAVFYCIYHCFLSIISKFGYKSRNQECTIALVRYLKEQNKINFDEKFIIALETSDESERHESNVIEKREIYTYGTSTSVSSHEELQKSINLCKDCISQTKEIVFGE